MKKLIEQVDQLLAMLSVSGDSVMLLADARKILGEVYRALPDEAAKPDEAAEPEKAKEGGGPK